VCYACVQGIEHVRRKLPELRYLLSILILEMYVVLLCTQLIVYFYYSLIIATYCLLLCPIAESCLWSPLIKLDIYCMQLFLIDIYF